MLMIVLGIFGIGVWSIEIAKESIGSDYNLPFRYSRFR